MGALPAECGIDLGRQLVEIGGHADLAAPAAWNTPTGRLCQRHKAGDRATCSRNDDLLAGGSAIQQL